jgi:GT2 family glycosyltransferase
VACARNCGIQCAVGSWIAFFDDDQVADPAWLLELFNAATSRSARVVGGAVRLLLSEDALAELPTVCRQLLGESVALPAPERFHRKLTAASGSLLVHRTVFKEVGAFDETLREAGEDTDLSRRMQAAGIEGWYVPASIAYHTVPAYRREEGYFRWTSLRNGMHLARRERQPLGWPLFVLVLLARMARVGVKHVPQYAWGRLCGSRTTRLAAQCQLWRIEGYVRAALAAASPRLFPQERFLASMDFRSERQTFVGGARPSAAT